MRSATISADGISVDRGLNKGDYSYLAIVTMFPRMSNTEAVNSFLSFTLPAATVNIDKFNWPQD